MARRFPASSIANVGDHLTPEQSERFRAGTATAAELFAWADHTASCDDCRTTTVDAEQVVAVHRSMTTIEVPRSSSEFLGVPRRWIAAAAAAALVFVVLGVSMRRTDEGQAGLPVLHQVHIPQMAIELRETTSELRGRAQQPKTLVPMSPIGRILIEDRPVFEWTSARRSRYVVEVFDDQYRPVAVSPRLSATRWVPPQPLPAGRILTWQVTADDGTTTITSPRPPSGEARFSVLDRTRAGELRALESRPRPALSLAIAYAESGALAEAQEELSALIAVNRDADAARQLLSQVQRVSP